MASPKYEVIFLYDAVTGQPKAGAAPVFASYKDTSGTAVTPPSIIELPGNDGAYAFLPVFADATKGVRYIVDSGSDLVMPRYSARYMRPEDWNSDYISADGAGYTVKFYSDGDTVAPVITQVSAPRNNQVKVTFSEPMTMTADADGALRASNYSIAPSVTILGVTQVTSQQVLLTTSTQIPNKLYTLTVVNVTDVHGVPIAS